MERKDDQGDTTECVNAMNALISEGIQLVVGSATSGCTSAITSIANSEGVVLITPSGTADSLTTQMDYVFRTCFRDSFQGQLAAQYAADKGYTKVGIVYCSADTYSSGLRDAFVSACCDKGIDIVARGVRGHHDRGGLHQPVQPDGRRPARSWCSPPSTMMSWVPT